MITHSIASYLPLFLKGMSITCSALLISGMASLCIGSIFGILSCNYLGYTKTKAMIRIYTFIAKGIPAYVQILIAYYVIPGLLGIDIPAMTAACGALALCSSGYMTEIIRSGINSVPAGQWDACTALGYPLSSALKRIIIPQTIQHISPALFGEFEQLLKSTSLLATIGITELTRTGVNIISRTLNPIPIYLVVACGYLLFSALLNGMSLYIEKRLSHGQH